MIDDDSQHHSGIIREITVGYRRTVVESNRCTEVSRDVTWTWVEKLLTDY